MKIELTLNIKDLASNNGTMLYQSITGEIVGQADPIFNKLSASTNPLITYCSLTDYLSTKKFIIIKYNYYEKEIIKIINTNSIVTAEIVE